MKAIFPKNVFYKSWLEGFIIICIPTNLSHRKQLKKADKFEMNEKIKKVSQNWERMSFFIIGDYN